MTTTGRSVRYAAVFREGTSAPTLGGVRVDEERLLLIGRSSRGRVELSLPYSELGEVRIGRGADECLGGRPALMVTRRNAAPLQIQPIGMGLLHELADLLAALTSHDLDRREKLAVVVPLRPGCIERAKALLDDGPPFDPGALGLESHTVFLTEQEAVFTFSGPHVREKLERAARSPDLWQAGLAWRSCIAGRPRLCDAAEVSPAGDEQIVFSWARTEA